MTIDTLIWFIMGMFFGGFLAFLSLACIIVSGDEKNKYKRGEDDDSCERCDSSDKKSELHG